VDAIFGTGFEGAPRAPAADAIEAINDCGAPVISADIASGVNASTGEIAGSAVRADVTVAFHAAKIGHRVHPGKACSGEVVVADIGIPAGEPHEAAVAAIRPEILDVPPGRGAESTKFTSGQVVVVGGSRGLTGAVVLSASAAIRAGAGYATVAVPADLEAILEVKLTEVMSRGFAGAAGRLASDDAAAVLALCQGANAVVLGPGVGREADSLTLARWVAAGVDAPLVLDADGLKAHAGRLEYLTERGAPTVLTPHAGELGRLLVRSSSEIGEHRLASAREAAERANAIVVLKGDDTIIAEPEGRVAINTLSSPGLATAGTGDVLSGTIGALLARGVEPFAAAACAVHACTRAGIIAAGRAGGDESVIATDVIDALGPALAAGELEAEASDAEAPD
jgi:NAD(P)H-hydrate epimerase